NHMVPPCGCREVVREHTLHHLPPSSQFRPRGESAPAASAADLTANSLLRWKLSTREAAKSSPRALEAFEHLGQLGDPLDPEPASLLSWSKRSPLVIRTRSCPVASRRSVSSTPGSSSVGCMSMRLPQPRITSRSEAGMRAPVSSIAVSSIDRVNDLTP